MRCTRARMGGTRLTTRRCRTRLRGWTKKLLLFEANGDRAGVEAWFAKYDVMPPSLIQALDTTKDIPVDITPRVRALPRSAAMKSHACLCLL